MTWRGEKRIRAEALAIIAETGNLPPPKPQGAFAGAPLQSTPGLARRRAMAAIRALDAGDVELADGLLAQARSFMVILSQKTRDRRAYRRALSPAKVGRPPQVEINALLRADTDRLRESDASLTLTAALRAAVEGNAELRASIGTVTADALRARYRKAKGAK